MATGPEHLRFLEEVTRQLAAAFQQVHRLCLDEIERLKQPQQIEEEQPEVLEEIQVEQVEPESPEEAEKEQKTKKIKKDGEDKAVDEKMKKKGKAVSHKPKAPASSFLHFFKQNQSNISKTYPTYGVTQLTKVAAKCWKELSNEEKEPFIKQCDEERKLYQQKMEQYRIDFPEEVAEKARKPNKKERKTSPNVNTPKKEKDEGADDNADANPNTSLVVVGGDASDSENEEEIDSLGV